MSGNRNRTIGAYQRNSTSAFTLVELLISVFVFLLAAGAAFASLNASARLSEAARNRMIALQDVRAVLEEIKARDVTAGTIANLEPAVETMIGNGDFYSTVPVYDVDGTMTGTTPALNSEAITIECSSASGNCQAGDTLVTYTVTATWVGARDRSYSLSVTTQKSVY